MQRALRRSLLARNQALKRERRDGHKALKEEEKEIRGARLRLVRMEAVRKAVEKKERREDWILGPLAPNRVAGRGGDTYGLVDMQSIRPPNVLKKDREKELRFAVNDRVVVVEGRERGKIGKIESLDEERQFVELGGLNMADLKVPKSIGGNSKTPFRTISLPLPLRSIRLVVALKDHFTGKVEDAVIDHVRTGAPFLEQPHGSNLPSHSRYIAGPAHIPIPWPRDDVTEYKAEPVDTVRQVVDEHTYDPSHLDLPLPDTAGYELHSQKNKVKPVHSQEYAEKKMREDAEDQWKKRRRMTLPQQEYEARRLKVKVAQGPAQVSQETLDLIQETQTRNLTHRMEAVAIT